jgi:hypothetical protein
MSVLLPAPLHNTLSYKDATTHVPTTTTTIARTIPVNHVTTGVQSAAAVENTTA